MKVILLKDVANVGKKGTVKELANGFAQNFLIARGLAEIATASKVKNAEKAVTEGIAKQEEARAALEAGIKKLKGEGLIIRVTANEKEHLFEALHADVIVSHLQDIIGVVVEESSIIIDTPIKALGTYTVHVAVGSKKVPVTIAVEAK